MEINAPKFFWYCCGISILWLTMGLTILFWRSQEVSFDVLDTKIQLSGAATDLQVEYEKLKLQEATTTQAHHGPTTSFSVDKIDERIQSLNNIKSMLTQQSK